MQALIFDQIGSLDALRLAECPRPTPGAGEALVQIKAAGLNPSDYKNVLGLFPYTTVPRIPGRDFSGVVVEGPQHLVGKAVWGTGKGIGFTRDGAHAQLLATPAAGLALKPQALSFEQAAAMGTPYITAFDALERCAVRAGTRLLVIGAAGAVGAATLAFARWTGAQVLAAVRKPAQQKKLAAEGCDTLLLDTPEALAAQVQTVFPRGADVIFDTTGAWLPPAVTALADFGRIAVIAAQPAGQPGLPVLALYRRAGSVVGTNSLLFTPEESARMFERWHEALERGALAPPAAPETVPLAQGVEAYRRVAAGGADKLVLSMV